MDRTILAPPRARLGSERDTGTPESNNDFIADSPRDLRSQNWIIQAIPQLNPLQVRYRQRGTSELPMTVTFDLESLLPRSHQRRLPDERPLAAARPRDRTSQAARMNNSNTAQPEEPRVQSEGTRHSPAERRSQRREKLLSLLKPIGSDQDIESSWVFLCWGKKTECTIMPVRIPNSTSEVEAWKLINKAWYSSRGKWRRSFSMLDVQKIEVVKV